MSEQGTLALWKGLEATLLRVFFGAGVYFVALDKVSKAVATAAAAATATSPSSSLPSGVASSSSFVKNNTAASFVSGAVARTIAAVLLSPVAVVKTRMEFAPRGQSGFRNPLHGIFKIARSEGVGGLYSGLFATILRDAPYAGLYFATYQYLVHTMDSRAAAAASASAATARSAPAPELAEGFSAGIFSSIPASGKNFLAAMVAGACATLVTQPADLIRTQQQLAVSCWAGPAVEEKVLRRVLFCAFGA